MQILFPVLLTSKLYKAKVVLVCKTYPHSVWPIIYILGIAALQHWMRLWKNLQLTIIIWRELNHKGKCKCFIWFMQPYKAINMLQKKESVDQNIVLIFVLLNAVILETALVNNEQWYWLLLITLPLLLLVIFRNTKNRKRI